MGLNAYPISTFIWICRLLHGTVCNYNVLRKETGEAQSQGYALCAGRICRCTSLGTATNGSFSPFIVGKQPLPDEFTLKCIFLVFSRTEENMTEISPLLFCYLLKFCFLHKFTQLLQPNITLYIYFYFMLTLLEIEK